MITSRMFTTVGARCRAFATVAIVLGLGATLGTRAAAQSPSTPQNVRVLDPNVVLATATVSVSPSTVSLAAGAQQQFTVTITGTSNSSVVWTATGGTVTADGLFTAGSTAGTFQVSATLKYGTIAGSAVVNVCSNCAQTTTRDWRKWPFSSTSPWNYPIGTLANYSSVSGLTSLGVGFNYNGAWTSSIVQATDTDPLAPIYWRQDVWSFLANGGKVCGNTASAESTLKQGATQSILFPANYYSTLSTPDSSLWVLPADYKPASTSYWSSARLPSGACPSPDTDGLMSVFQPSGWVLDLYDAVVMSDGSVISAMATYVDAKGDGTGWSNGRRASMLPAFAGLVRKGEIASGLIPHALSLQMSPTILTQQAIWPAYTFDRNSGYSGTLPMGALLAIPQSVNIDGLGLSPQGKVVAQALQKFGAYVTDRGGSGGMTFLAELGNTEINWSSVSQDLQIIRNQLKWVSNNTAQSPGGGGTPLAPMAPPLQ